MGAQSCQQHRSQHPRQYRDTSSRMNELDTNSKIACDSSNAIMATTIPRDNDSQCVDASSEVTRPWKTRMPSSRGSHDQCTRSASSQTSTLYSHSSLTTISRSCSQTSSMSSLGTSCACVHLAWSLRQAGFPTEHANDIEDVVAEIKHVLDNVVNGIEYGGMQCEADGSITAGVVRRLREQLDLMLDPKDFRRPRLYGEEEQRLGQLWFVLRTLLSFLFDIENTLSVQMRMRRSLMVKVERALYVAGEAFGHGCEDCLGRC